jgi:hypothetical protein
MLPAHHPPSPTPHQVSLNILLAIIMSAYEDVTDELKTTPVSMVQTSNERLLSMYRHCCRLTAHALQTSTLPGAARARTFVAAFLTGPAPNAVSKPPPAVEQELKEIRGGGGFVQNPAAQGYGYAEGEDEGDSAQTPTPGTATGAGVGTEVAAAPPAATPMLMVSWVEVSRALSSPWGGLRREASVRCHRLRRVTAHTTNSCAAVPRFTSHQQGSPPRSRGRRASPTAAAAGARRNAASISVGPRRSSCCENTSGWARNSRAIPDLHKCTSL